MPAVTGSRLIILTALLLLLVVVAASACLADADETGSGGLCASFLATTIGPLLMVALAVAGYVRPAAANASAVSAIDLPVPPPKS
jgi:hypothetical protein